MDISLHKLQGFSLIELVITIVVISILAIFPFINWPGTTLNVTGQAQQFVTDVRYTQALAMSKAQRYRLVINPVSNSYQILNSAGTAVLLSSGSSTVTLSSGISFGTLSNLPNNMIVFDSNGIPYTDTGSPGTTLAANASIPLQSSDTTKTAVITPSTGKVTVQ